MFLTVIREFLPGSLDACYLGLTTELTLSTDFPGYTRHFASKCLKLVRHGIDGILERCDFGVHLDIVNGDLFGEITAGD